MKSAQAKKYKLWSKIFLVIGLFGLLDIEVGVLFREKAAGLPQDGGGLTFMILYAFAYLFGTKVAATFLPFIMIISATWFIWLGVYAILRRKVKKLEKEPNIVSEGKIKSNN